MPTKATSHVALIVLATSVWAVSSGCALSSPIEGFGEPSGGSSPSDPSAGGDTFSGDGGTELYGDGGSGLGGYMPGVGGFDVTGGTISTGDGAGAGVGGNDAAEGGAPGTGPEPAACDLPKICSSLDACNIGYTPAECQAQFPEMCIAVDFDAYVQCTCECREAYLDDADCTALLPCENDCWVQAGCNG